MNINPVVFLVGLFLSVVSATSFSQQQPVPDSIVFSRSNVDCPSGVTACKLVHYTWGWQTLPPRDSDGQGFVYGFKNKQKPDNASTQWIVFKFRSEGLFTQMNGAHLGVIGRHDGNEGRYNRGRGFIIGNAGRPEVPCVASTGFAAIQPEVWFDPATRALPPPYGQGINSGNIILGRCDTKSITDYQTYQVVLHVTESGYAYNITDRNGVVVANQYVPYPTNSTVDSQLNITNAGFLIGLVNAEGGNWRFVVSDLNMGWF
ncbi:MAG: hypothetical protein HC848_04695 [Limnobacter sp.]|nr:hypothetical protein [Limnobacter sp.]